MNMDQSPPPAGFSELPVRPQLVPEPALPPRKPRMWVRLLRAFLLLVLLGSLALNAVLFGVVGLMGFGTEEESRVQEKYFTLNRYGTEKVAILSIEGTILSGEGFFKQQIDHATKDAKDGNLKALVVHVNSPGGTITGSDYMLHYLRKFAADTHVPIVVSMGGVAASGGYYVSMCVGDTPETIFAEPTTWTGSIGVVIPHFNLAELLEKWGIQEDDIASHRLKTMGSFARKMTEEEKKIFQELVDQGFTEFKDAIKEGRPKFRKDPAVLDKLATGQVYTAQQALENGLIDKIGFIEDAIDQVISLAKLDKESVKVVKYKSEPRLSDLSSARPAFSRASTWPPYWRRPPPAPTIFARGCRPSQGGRKASAGRMSFGPVLTFVSKARCQHRRGQSHFRRHENWDSPPFDDAVSANPKVLPPWRTITIAPILPTATTLCTGQNWKNGKNSSSRINGGAHDGLIQPAACSANLVARPDNASGRWADRLSSRGGRPDTAQPVLPARRRAVLPTGTRVYALPGGCRAKGVQSGSGAASGQSAAAAAMSICRAPAEECPSCWFDLWA